jgi:hypothetical protein
MAKSSAWEITFVLFAFAPLCFASFAGVFYQAIGGAPTTQKE